MGEKIQWTAAAARADNNKINDKINVMVSIGFPV